MFKQVFFSLVVILLVFLGGATAFAAGSGAYRVDMPDARALGMGGAFVGVADSAAAVYYNPAGMIQLSKPEISVGVSLLQPKEHVHLDAGGRTKMQQDSFLIPNIFFSTKLGQNFAIGVGVTSSWGLGTTWAEDSFARYVSTRASVQNKDYLLNTAYKLNDQLSFGAGIVVDASSLSKEKKVNQSLFNPGDADGNFKLAGDNTGAGFQVSSLYKVNEKHQFGVQYSSEIHHKYHGKVHLDNLSPTVQGLYNFSAASYETDFVMKSTLPQSVDLGYSYKATDKLRLSVDVLWMDWSSVKKEELGYPNETDTTGAFGGRRGFLNDGNPANRDWHSAFSMAMGTEYNLSDRLRLRGGYFFHQSPVPQDTWELNLPDANSHSVVTGFGYDITKSLTFDLAYGAMFYQARHISNSAGDSVGGSIDGKYRQWINLVVATATYKF